MKIFLSELKTRHQASSLALYKRHKSGIGYLILLIGVIAALAGVVNTQNEMNYNGEIKNAIMCENITRTDRQTLENLHTKVDRELIKSLHLTQQQVNESVTKQLRLSSEQRQALQPSRPHDACASNITTLKKGTPPTIRENLLAHKTK